MLMSHLKVMIQARREKRQYRCELRDAYRVVCASTVQRDVDNLFENRMMLSSHSALSWNFLGAKAGISRKSQELPATWVTVILPLTSTTLQDQTLIVLVA
ncbi:hypothetical protein B0T21DRAFT_356408 [Apiosordaria backusii]|uniref:Uncharacterized protein n=1 Tax=Apiosordaria backusii TaxID=314023 RepID=A0AA40K709_9PEZI|nr:hypothetical protein B0T21DRAFT_356408 [Apiosordaria backusii]